MRSYRALTAALCRSTLREPVGFFFTIVFAPALVLILGLIFGNDPDPDFGGVGYISRTLPAFASLVLAIVGVMTMPLAQLQLRETGALTRLRATPLRPATFVAADLTVNFVLGVVGMFLALLLGILVFGVDAPDSLPQVVLACALGLVAFLALGYTLAALYPSVGAATGIGNILMILLMLTSGAFVPLSELPDGVQRVMDYSPVRHFVDLVQGLWNGEAWSTLWTPTLVLVGMVVVFGALGVVLFRWDNTRR